MTESAVHLTVSSTMRASTEIFWTGVIMLLNSLMNLRASRMSWKAMFNTKSFLLYTMEVSRLV